MPQRHMPAITLLTFHGFLQRAYLAHQVVVSVGEGTNDSKQGTYWYTWESVLPFMATEETREQHLRNVCLLLLLLLFQGRRKQVCHGKEREQMEHFYLSVKNQETEVKRDWNQNQDLFSAQGSAVTGDLQRARMFVCMGEAFLNQRDRRWSFLLASGVALSRSPHVCVT